MAGAVLQPAAAQSRDTMPLAQTKPPTDSMPRDTIKAPIAEAELPVLADPGGSYHWTRRTMFETGALTVQDLLDRVPGLTGLRSNWIAQPMTAAYLGDPRRVRVFLDGVELEALDPRQRRVFDLSQVPIWSLDDLLVERTAAEVRLHLRTWRVDRTTPFTRTDIYTGDLNTNLYRGLFGRRYGRGEVLQLAAQQFSTTPGRFSDGSDQLGLFTRLGIARGGWTADVVMHSNGRNRGTTLAEALDDTVPATESGRRDAQFRLAWRDTARGAWVQGLAATSRYEFTAPRFASIPDSTTTLSRAQFVLTGGYRRGALSASVTQRYRTGMSQRVATPSARLGWDARYLSVSLSAEGRGVDSTRRLDASVVVRPLSFVYLGAGVATEQPQDDTIGSPSFARLEAGVRVRDLWLGGGVLGRSRIELDPALGRASTPAVIDSAAAGSFASVRGRLWRAVYVNAHLTRWADTLAYYRAQYQAHTELYISTSLPQRFPSGNFHFRASVAHEYRSAILWPDTAGAVRVPGYRTFTTHLQFKIVAAEVFWTYRNALDERYPEIPGYRLPRLSSIYGVRWEFWN